MKSGIERLADALTADGKVTCVVVCSCGQKNRVDLIKMIALAIRPRCGACKGVLKVHS